MRSLTIIIIILPFVMLSCEESDTDTTGTVTDIDGNIYNMVIIGDQEWMAENLKVTHFRNGDTITNQMDYGDDDSSVYRYGALYDWYTVDDTRNIAPDGWHVPSDSEWQILINHLGGDSTAGGKMKATGSAYWNSPNTGATNESGFSALPGGYYGGAYFYMGYYATFWSSTEYNNSNSVYYQLGYNHSAIGRHSLRKDSGFSIRCVRD